MKARNFKHGCARVGANTPEYRAWLAMRDRCNCKRHSEFPRYGARGIRVCERWEDFSHFLADMGLKPSPSHSLDRIDSNGHYETFNCRWATPSVQQRNKRTSINLTLNGETHHVLEWAKRLNLSLNTIRRRLKTSRDAAIVLRPPQRYTRKSA